MLGRSCASPLDTCAMTSSSWHRGMSTWSESVGFLTVTSEFLLSLFLTMLEILEVVLMYAHNILMPFVLLNEALKGVMVVS